MHLRNGGLDDVFPDPARRTDYVESQCGAGGALVSLGLDLALDGISTRRQGEFWHRNHLIRTQRLTKSQQ